MEVLRKREIAGNSKKKHLGSLQQRRTKAVKRVEERYKKVKKNCKDIKLSINYLEIKSKGKRWKMSCRKYQTDVKEKKFPGRNGIRKQKIIKEEIKNMEMQYKKIEIRNLHKFLKDIRTVYHGGTITQKDKEEF